MAETMIDAAIVGCGRIAGGYDETASSGPPRTHAGAYRARGDVRLVACVDPDSERRAAFRRRWGVEREFASLDDMAAAGICADIVSVCTPGERHAADLDALLAMDVGAVLCEKPLAPDLTQARAAVSNYGVKGRPLAVAHFRRWDPNIVELAALIRAGTYGALQSGTGFYGKGLFNNGSHLIDLFATLVGWPEPLSAADRFAGPGAGDPTPDCVLRAPCGAPFRLIATDHTRYDLFELFLVFDAAVVELREGASRVTVRAPIPTPGFAGHRRPGAGDSWPPRQDEAFARMIGATIDAAVRGTPVACDGATALRTLSICAALAAGLSRN